MFDDAVPPVVLPDPYDFKLSNSRWLYLDQNKLYDLEAQKLHTQPGVKAASSFACTIGAFIGFHG
jgi:hypothetical protein